MLSDTQGRRLNKYVSDYVVFDLETTGTSSNNDAVVEISAVKVKYGQVQAEFSTLVDPERPIPYWATQVNGISDEMVQGMPTFDRALKDFLDFAGNEVLVGHNIHCFDMKFLYRDAMNYWGKIPDNDYVDTLTLSRQCLPEMKHHTLGDLAQHYGISTVGAHRALNDCRMNQQVFECLGAMLKQPGSKGLLLCPKCGQIMKKRNGRFGEFWGCSGYPNCRYTRNITC